MQYIHLNDDSYILHTSEGMTTLNRKSFNFHTIKSLINKGADEDKVLPLLETPELPNGLYELYLDENNNDMHIKHMKKEGEVNWSTLGSGNPGAITADSGTFMGVYASEQDIMSDWPEYII